MSDFPIRTRYPLALPGVHNRNAIVNDHIATLDGAVGNEWEVRIALLEGNGPVNKVKLGLLAIAHGSHWMQCSYVKVIQLQLSKTSIQRGLDNLRAVLATCRVSNFVL